MLIWVEKFYFRKNVKEFQRKKGKNRGFWHIHAIRSVRVNVVAPNVPYLENFMICDNTLICKKCAKNFSYGP